MHTRFRNTRLKTSFQLLPFILLLVVSGAFGQFTGGYEDLVPRYPNQMDGRVNMVKGRFSFAATDLVVPGRGLSLDFTRYYHGTVVSSRYRSYLGQGWSHSYQWELDYEGKPDGDGGTEHYWHVITGSGAQQTFKEDSNRTAGDIPADKATLNPGSVPPLSLQRLRPSFIPPKAVSNTNLNTIPPLRPPKSIKIMC